MKAFAADAILFDASGTLFDDLEAAWMAAVGILGKHGIRPLSLPEFRREVCEPHWKFFAKMGIPYSGLRDDLPGLIRDGYSDALVKPFPEVNGTLQGLRADGMPMGVVSQTPKEILTGLLRKFSLSRFFDVVVAAEDCIEQKPSPIPIRRALNSLGLREGSRAAYVGDMREDVVAARRAGIISVAVTRAGSFNLKSALLAESPDYTVRSLSGLRLRPLGTRMRCSEPWLGAVRRHDRKIVARSRNGPLASWSETLLVRRAS